MKFNEVAISYNGNKLPLLKLGMLDYFPKNINTFYDLFGGSGIVSMNVNARKYILNDYSPTYQLYYLFKNIMSEKNFWKLFDSIIDKHKIDLTKPNTPKYTKKYQEIRFEYNNLKFSLTKCMYLYILNALCFSTTMRFNSKGEFNQTCGNRSLSDKMCERISNTINWFNLDNVHIFNNNAFDLEITKLKINDFVYLDPPYSITSAGYNCSNFNDELLFNLCLKLDKANIKWAMSNVLKHRGKTNYELKKFIKDNNYFVKHFREMNYTVRGTSNSNSDEVLICNY